MQDFQSAEWAFEQVLKLDPNNQEAFNDLFFIQMKKLMDMGFSKKKATAALHKFKTLNVSFLTDYYMLLWWKGLNPTCLFKISILVKIWFVGSFYGIKY